MRYESLFLLLSGPLLAALAWDGFLSPADGALMMLVLVLFFFTLYRASCRGETCAVVTEEIERVEEVRPRRGPMIGMLIAAGAAFLALGAEAVVEGASGIALGAGVSAEIVGLTVVAVGTTIPEMSVAFAASRKRQSDVVLGNVVGTIIINTLFILGLGALVGGYRTAGLETAIGIGFMIFVSTAIVILLAVLDRGGRRTGAALLATYASYLLAIILLFG
jgi:cation:H+ antiporter